MKQVMAVIFAGGMLCASLTGCSKPSDSTVQQTAGATESEAQTLAGNIDNNTPISQTDSGNVPVTDGEYVYDYQVSMDPIPKEIADLGGPCQGTIHAFPSKIEMGLTQKMMEEDPELKAEVEKRIPEVEQALKEEFGGEFRVDGVSTLLVNGEGTISDYDWHFFCTEVDTGYQFDLNYSNAEYSYKKGIRSQYRQNKLYTGDYCSQEQLEEKEKEIGGILTDNFGECLYRVQYASEWEFLDIQIMQFIDAEVEKSQEQERVLKTWKALKEYNEELWYSIDIRYYPTEYQHVIEQQCGSRIKRDLSFRYVKPVLEAGELKERFLYDDFFDEDNDDNLNFLLEQFERGTYDQTNIWSYWN